MKLDANQATLKRARKRRIIKDNVTFYIMLLPLVVLMFLFDYRPMYGIVIAFQDYLPGKSFFGEGVKWVGLKHFEEFINSFYFWRQIKNTLRMSIMGLVINFPAPIIFALLINEVVFPKTKKTIQTVSYFPHFISSVVVAGMALSFIEDDGLITNIINLFGAGVKGLNTKPAFYPWFIKFIHLWKGFGWGSILYLSTISSIDPGLYQAAEIDGATRLQRIWYITLPELKNLVMMQLIFAISAMLGADSELILLVYNPAVYETTDVISTYVYRVGLLGGGYSFGTATSLFMQVINFILLFIANKVSAKTADFSLW